MTVTTAEAPKHRTNLIQGPHGFTEFFNDEACEIMRRLGLIEKSRVTSASDWETTIWNATGLPMREDYR